MRIGCSITAVVFLFTGLVGCGKGPLFTNIREVKVQQIGPNGLVELEFDGAQAAALSKCLYQSTEVPGDQGKELLQSTYLIQVKDNYGERSFELYTESNFKGNKGKYYSNSCIYGIFR